MQTVAANQEETLRLCNAYERMILIRIAEERIAQHYLEHKIMSFVHFYVGQEAVAVGIADSLTPGDKMLGNHRSHGHYLAKGGDLTRMIAELLGKEMGSSHGKGGSMHMIDTSVNFVGSTPILGSAVPLGAGVAFAEKFHTSSNIVVSYVGDGAFEEGVVYETLNLAGLFTLPFLIVLENNLHSVNSSIADRRAPGHDVRTIVEGFGATYMRADGTDYADVYTQSSQAVAHIRSGKGPVVLECVTHRHMAHSAPIFDESVRKDDTVDIRKAQDAVKRLRAQLLTHRITEEKLTTIEERTRSYVENCMQTAITAPYPPTDSLYTDLYA